MRGYHHGILDRAQIGVYLDTSKIHITFDRDRKRHNEALERSTSNFRAGITDPEELSTVH